MISRAFRTFRKSVFVVFCSLLWVSCSNTKDGLINRTGHNLSAHYNGYYNAGLKLEEALDKLAASHVDHYDRILSVFQYADATKAKAIYPQLEDAMKRTSTVIQRHTIIDKRGNEKPESEKWLDENWVLYGKCQFFRHDYFEAMETFRFVESMYKKETGRHIASLWIAKTYLELTQLREAEGKLDYLRNQSDFPKKDRWELNAVNADYHLQTKNYDKAAEFLAKAAAEVKDREKKIRYLFILAQLHQQKNEFKQAFQLYTKVVKMNAPYEMSFNARLNRARCYDSSSGSSETVRKELRKMEKDPKNKEFLDQIYYALAGLSKNEGNEEEQIRYLNMSIRASTSNQNQKALSYLELGKIEYSKPDYRVAQAYYDSTISNLTNDHPDYTEILTRRNSLTKLVKYMKTIETEDSLQQLAKLSPMERLRAVNEVLSAEEEQQRKEKEAELQSNQIFDQSRQGEVNNFNKGSGSGWYFYNSQAISFGFNEFIKKFGERKLEDNWRRLKKEAITQSQPEEEVIIERTTEIRPDSSAAIELSKREKMMKSIPVGEEALEKSNGKIIEAYYNIGLIYKEQLKDLNAATEAFEELLRRFPTCKYQLQCYFQLYRTYATLGQMTKSDYYKNIILNEHGETEYAEIIRNPNYLADKAKKKSDLELFYEDTYRKYLNAEYSAVIARKGQADVQFPQNHLTPKFDLLKTLSVGRTQPLPSFEASLNDIVRNYPTDSVKDVAQEILDYIHDTKNVPPSVGEAPVPVSGSVSSAANQKIYTYMPDTTHFVVLIFQNIGGPLDPDRLRNRISDFNATNFGSKSLTMQDFLFDHRDKIFVVKTFPNKAEALQYSNAVYDNDNIFGNVNHDAYRLYSISVNNLPTLLGLKKTDTYEDFYRDFYK